MVTKKKVIKTKRINKAKLEGNLQLLKKELESFTRQRKNKELKDYCEKIKVTIKVLSIIIVENF